MPLTEHDKVRIRHHLGYNNVSRTFAFSLGIPSSMETQFIIEDAMNRVLEEAIPHVLRLVQILEGIEQQGIDDHELLAVNKVGEIEVRSEEHQQLDQRYRHWAGALCNALGIQGNPFDSRGGGPNVRVHS